MKKLILCLLLVPSLGFAKETQFRQEFDCSKSIKHATKQEQQKYAKVCLGLPTRPDNIAQLQTEHEESIRKHMNKELSSR